MAIDVRRVPFVFKGCQTRKYTDNCWRLYDAMGVLYGAITPPPHCGHTAEEIAKVITELVQDAVFPPPPIPYYDETPLKDAAVPMGFVKNMAKNLGCETKQNNTRQEALLMIAEKLGGKNPNPQGLILEKWAIRKAELAEEGV